MVILEDFMNVKKFYIFVQFIKRDFNALIYVYFFSWSKQGGSGTDSETEGDDVAAANINYAAAAAAAQRAAAAQQHHLQQQHISPQLTLAEFLQK